MTATETLLAELVEETRRVRRLLEGQGRDLLTAREAARRLGIERQRVPALIAAGVLRGVRDGRRWRIPAEEVARAAKEIAVGVPKRERTRRVRADTEPGSIAAIKRGA